MIEDVRLGPRVTPLAMPHIFPSGARQQSSRHATSMGVLVPWRCSKNAANRGYAPDAADVFNGTSIKANSAFMLAPLIPPAPFNKGGVERPSNIMSGIMRSRPSVTSANNASHT